MASGTRALVTVALLLAWPGSGRAEAPPGDEGVAEEPTDDPLAGARAALEQRRFAQALALSDPLRSSQASAVRAEALEVSAIALLALGRAAEGARVASELYDLEPGFVLEDGSLPRPVIDAFEKERAKPRARRVALALAPARGAPRALDVTAQGEVHELRVACRAAGRTAFVRPVPARAASSYRVELPTGGPHACFAIALDDQGLRVGSVGTADEPVEVLVEETAKRSSAPAAAAPARSPALTSRWWFWVGVGAATAAVAITVVATTTAGGSSDAGNEHVGSRVGELVW